MERTARLPSFSENKNLDTMEQLTTGADQTNINQRNTRAIAVTIIEVTT
jgi:hypothetical protein